MKPLQIFRSGTHTDAGGRTLTFNQADLQATARAYNPGLYEAPLVVGHPEIDAPSYGWIETLRCNGSALEATPRAVEPAFAEMVNAERFNRISASFFLPDAPNNPVRGAYYLRHVGFLGAAAPAVKGLRKPQFSADSAGVITIAFALPQVRETTVVVNPPIQGSAMTGATLTASGISPATVDRYAKDLQSTARSVGQTLDFAEAQTLARERLSATIQDRTQKPIPSTNPDDEQAAIERLAKILQDIARRDGKELSQEDAIAQATAKVRRQAL